MRMRLLSVSVLLVVSSLSSLFPAQAASKPTPKKAVAAKPAASESVAAKVDLTLAHGLDEVRASHLQTLIERFNDHDKNYRVVLHARSEGEAPALLNLLTRNEAATLAAGHEAFRPLYAVMREAKEKLDLSSLSPDVRSDEDVSKLTALPLAYGAPVLYFDKAAFRRAGLDPAKPPHTWAEVQATAGKLFDSGVKCPYTSSWPTWVHVDNLSVLNNASTGHGREFAFNGLVQVKHIALLASWYKSSYFKNFGRRNEADAHFAQGECGMLTSTSDIYASLRQAPGIELGVAPLPFHDDVYGSPRHTVADGSALWIGAGHKSAEYRGAARLVAFLAEADNQLDLVRNQGFLPLTSGSRSAVDKLANSTSGSDFAALQVAWKQLRPAGAKADSPSLRVAANPAVCKVVDEELEAVWADRKPAKEALDNAVVRANATLKLASRPLTSKP
jgi:sn-glycerol 3-phosphate transport system substrate-binding protein